MSIPQANSKIEKIPVRRPDGSFGMVEVGNSADSNIQNNNVTSAPIVIKQIPEEKTVETHSNASVQNQSGDLGVAQEAKSVDWQASVDKIIDLVDIQLFDDSAKNRLESVIMSRLRDVRDFLATKEVLTKDRSEGGLGLSDVDAVQVMNIIDVEYKILHAKDKKLTPPASISTGIGAISGMVEDPFDPKAKIDALVTSELPYTETNEYMNTIAASLNKAKSLETENKTIPKPVTTISEIKKPKIIPKEELPPVDIKPKPQSVIANIRDESIPPKPANTFSASTETGIKQKIVKPTSFTKPKPNMTDVVSEKRLMGPIDELRNMRLVDFRRLGNSTVERLQKIKSHIEELEDESFAKKVEAIQAWRSNPIYKMYVSIGSQGLMGTQTVADVIKEKQEKGEEVLTQEEFEEFTDFNKKLKY